MPDRTHRSLGVGGKTRVYCPGDGTAYGPHPDASFDVAYYPYCGEDATDDDHEIDAVIGEVFCEQTGMSTWRYCPNCGDRAGGTR